MFVDRSALLWEIDPDKMTPEQLDVIAEHLIQKALAGQPQEVVDAAVTAEELAKDLNGQEPKE
jgi:hypothetical protein